MSEPFDPLGRLVVVRAIAAGPRGALQLRLGVDTAATRTSLNGLILSRLGCREPAADRVVRTGSGSTRAGLTPVTFLRALGQARTDYPVLWLLHPPGGMIDGLLGLDFFRGLVLTLDFARGWATLRPARWWRFWR